jgi:hypothetical protein
MEYTELDFIVVIVEWVLFLLRKQKVSSSNLSSLLKIFMDFLSLSNLSIRC